MPVDAALLDLRPEGRSEAPAHYALGVSHSFRGRAWRFRAFDETQSRLLALAGWSGALAQILDQGSGNISHGGYLEILGVLWERRQARLRHPPKSRRD